MAVLAFAPVAAAKGDDRGPDDRGTHARGTDDMGMDARGTDDQGFDDRGMDDRGFDDNVGASVPRHP